ncbi:T9SS type A sorting domain-containing protein [Flammeovirga pectinis]|uniref:T9SS type A sorting domain-containing protein n=1 Tax=Flammeovirga pectinis TaxID=2494373 RepID=A0A3S9P5N9_9BACT|nr:T9SS type A sorting domain-containing protein [Flammeovirga pectinis]AZQ63539.1 T9SS type A sorting domain-containing protein [Flammeovirga pectinis]
MTKFYITLLFLTLSSFFSYAQDNDYSEYLLNKLKQDHFSNERTHVHTPRCGTPLYLEALNNWDKLNSKAQAAFSDAVQRHSFNSPKVYETTYFTLHYTNEGDDAVDQTDQDGNNIPDYIDLVAKISDNVFKIDIQDRGFNSPPADNTGGSDKPDIYIYSLNAGVYGTVVPENNLGNNSATTITEVASYTSHMNLRNNYDNFNNSEEENLKVTLAHELSHMIDFGYNYNFPTWFLEAKGAWEEKRIYPDLTDNFQYISSFTDSDYALDYGKYTIDNNTDESSRWYSGWLFFQLIYENLEDKDHPFLRKILERGITYVINDEGYTFIDEELESLFEMDFTDIHRVFRITNGILTDDKKITENYAYNDAAKYRKHLREYYTDDTQNYYFLHQDIGPIYFENEVSFNGESTDSVSYNGNSDGNSRLNRLSVDYLSLKTENLDNISLELMSNQDDEVNIDIILYNSTTNKIEVKSGSEESKIQIEKPGDYATKIIVITRNDVKLDGDADAEYEIKLTKNVNTVTSLLDELNTITISPNPTNGLINISYQDKDIKNIYVHDITGKLKGTYKANTFNTEVSLEGKNGMYFITLDNGKTFKVIKN